MRIQGYASWVCEAGAHGKSGEGYGIVPVGKKGPWTWILDKLSFN
nr:hypothetical protein [Tanacetum cinerariifolium]